jgi:hypothetical protein
MEGKVPRSFKKQRIEGKLLSISSRRFEYPFYKKFNETKEKQIAHLCIFYR